MFDFRNYVDNFDEHIKNSIPSYEFFNSIAIELSKRSIENNTNVLDIGCSTGKLLHDLKNIHKNVNFIGIEPEKKFDKYHENLNIIYDKIENIEIPNNISFCVSLFTLQFINYNNKIKILKEIYKNMISGSSLVISEKFYFKYGKTQNYLDSMYNDFKKISFTFEEIFKKEIELRGTMHCQTKKEFENMLENVGFNNFENIFQHYHFSMYVIFKE